MIAYPSMNSPASGASALPDGIKRKVLVLFCHPAMERSRVNMRLVESAKALPGLTFHDLYEAYPRFDIDVKREQGLLLEHEIIVMHHPFYWYSCPPLLKQWMDLVLEHGFAYGKNGKALRGKAIFNAITTGGPQQAYSTQGNNRFTIRQLLAPFDQTARLCGMHYLAPFVVHGTLWFQGAEDAAKGSENYLRVLRGLMSEGWDLDKAMRADYLTEVF